MNVVKYVLVTVLLVFSFSVMGQRRYAANRYFKEFSYPKAAELYQRIHEKGDNSYEVLSRLGDSHYFNNDFKKAAEWYAVLMKTHEPVASADHIFRYAQSLKSTGKVSESDMWLLKLKSYKGEDSRAFKLENNKDYFAEYSNENKAYINLHNLSVNTKYSDFGGFIYDGNLYFASTRPSGSKYDKKKYKWNNQPYLNMYKSSEKLISDEGVIEVKDTKVLTGVSTRYHESNPVITNDGNTMYFTRDNFDGKKLKGDKDKVSHLKIYRATKGIDGSWKHIEELPFNSDLYSVGHPALSSDENTLYFVSDMQGGKGHTDIYKVDILKEGGYGDVENLGETINTEGREMFPYLDGDNTLYFASDGHLGLGALDVFESKYEGNTFTTPVNLGKPVNSSSDDFSFVINNEHSHGYFSSNRKGGKGDDDIYSFILFKCQEDIEGVVTEKGTNKPIKDVKVRLVDEKGQPVSQVITTNEGKYVFKSIDCENTYTVVASKDDFRDAKDAAITEDIDKKTIVTNLQLESLIVKPTEEQAEAQIVIRPIYFDFDLYNIREDAEYELEHIVTVMQNHPDMSIRIESHTDSRGAKSYNRTLSDNRAKSTRDYLVSRGISRRRIISAIGYGETQLLNDCNDVNQNKCSEEEHQLNRRSYFYIVKGNDIIKVSGQQK